MHMLLARAMTALCALTSVGAFAGPSLAQDYPNRPVHLIVGFAPGGTTDVTARLIAQALSELWGQQIVVDNRPGAGTAIAAGITAQAAPDGYTLFQNSSSQVVVGLVQKQLNYDPIKDFTPISKVLSTPNVILVNKTIPVRNLTELIALARAKPGQLSYGNPGHGTITHLGGELFKQMADVDLVAIPYRGGALSVQALMAGELPMTFNTLPEVMAQIQAGTVRPIAVTTAQRAPTLPDLPTIAETVPGYEVEVWQAWFGPAGMTPRVIAKINADLVKVLAMPALRQRFADLGAEAISSTPAALLTTMRNELSRWTRVVQIAGIQAE
jgi:tripartite-type tricarboxylate transporter receptor subunit TctC